MLINSFLMWAVFAAIFVVGLVALVGFFWSKKGGFGPYNTSTLLILLVLIISALLVASGKLTADLMTNILLAVLGFAGGLFANTQSNQ